MDSGHKGKRARRQDVGARGEKLAAEFLAKQGYKILKRNYRCREGEIDIIAQQEECLVFVEVRTRKSSDFGAPEESITISKKEKLVSLTDSYLQNCEIVPPSWRIDVIAIELDSHDKVSRLEHIENAIE